MVINLPRTLINIPYQHTSQAIVKRPDLPLFENMAITSDQMTFDGNSTSESDNLSSELSQSTNLEAGKVNQQWGVIRIGLYARHIRRWFRYFPRESFHFVSGERLIR